MFSTIFIYLSKNQSQNKKYQISKQFQIQPSTLTFGVQIKHSYFIKIRS